MKKNNEKTNVMRILDQNKIPYVGVKVISNFAYNNAIRQYNLYEEEAILTSQKIAGKFIKNYYD